MNIFVLDKSPVLAAKYHCDKHCVKMILEAGQMMCAAHWFHSLNSVGKTLKDFKRIRDAREYALQNADPALIPPWSLSHTGHPCTLWTSKNISNYYWHASLMRSLLDEYTMRYRRTHKSEIVYKWLVSNTPWNMKSEPLTEHPQCMPEECKVPGDPVAAYRNYYHMYKAYMAKWNKGPMPHWWNPDHATKVSS